MNEKSEYLKFDLKHKFSFEVCSYKFVVSKKMNETYILNDKAKI